MKKVNPTRSFTSTNFWFSVVSLLTIVLGVLGVNINPAELEGLIVAVESKQLTSILVALVGAGMMLYNAFKSQKITGTLKDVLNYRNFWTALFVVIGGVLARFNYDFPVDQAESIVDAIGSGDITLIVVAAWTFIQTIYKMFSQKQPEQAESAKWRGTWEVEVLYNVPITYPALKVSGTPVNLPVQIGSVPYVMTQFVKNVSQKPELRDIVPIDKEWEMVRIVSIRKS